MLIGNGRPVPFSEGDLAYISTRNISFPKGLARKMVPKYIGPYRILKDFANSSFRLELPSNLKSRGIHDVFHVSLLRIHVPNDDRLFLGELITKLALQMTTRGEWAVDQIIGHSGSRTDALFQVKWKSGDVTWLPYEKTDHLDALSEYFDALGIENVSQLRDSRIPVPGDNDNDVEEVGGIRLSALELDPSQLTKPLRQPLKKRLSVTHQFPSPIPLIPQPLISSLSSLSSMSRTYNTLKYRKDGTVAFEGVLRKDNGMWLLEKVDSLDSYLITDDELEILVEFSVSSISATSTSASPPFLLPTPSSAISSTRPTSSSMLPRCRLTVVLTTCTAASSS